MNTKNRVSGVSVAIKKFLSNNHDANNTKGLALYHIEVANTLKKREEVFKMVYQAYLEKGFIPENSKKWHVIPQDISPDTIILLARDQYGAIAGTVTLVFDQSVSLPANKIYSEEIRELRNKGEVIAEVSRLAISKKHRHSKEILSLLFNHLVIYCNHVKKVSSLICEVNPRHFAYYKSILNFEQIGALKPCPMVQENPAILLHLSIQNFNALVNTHKESSKFKPLYSLNEAANIANNLSRNRKAITINELNYFNLNQKPTFNLFH